MFSWLWMTAAHASPLCDALLVETPRTEAVRAALVASDDPNELCRWVGPVPMSHTFGGVVALVLLPVISWPVVFTEEVSKKKKAMPLVLALERLAEDGVVVLLEAGARPHEGALDDAVARDRWVVVEALVRAGARPVLTALGPPLAGDLGRLRRLTELGIRLDGVSSVHEGGALLVDPTVAAAFLERGLAPETLLGPVVAEGSAAVLDLCLSRIRPTDGRAVDALREAAAGGRWDLVDRLRAVGVPWELRGREPVVIAMVGAGSTRDLVRVLALGADPAARGVSGDTALHVAVQRGRADLVSALIDGGAPVDASDTFGATPLAQAAERGRADLVELLIARGASPAAGNPLAAALESRELDVAGVLLGEGAPVNDDTVRRQFVVRNGEGVRYLLAHGLAADRILDSGESLAVLAVRAGDLGLLRTLVDGGAPLDGDEPGTSALRAAIDTGVLLTIDRVVALGADPARVPTDGMWGRLDPALEHALVERFHLVPPPEQLTRAVRSGERAEVAWLLAQGVDPNRPDGRGDLPISLVRDPAIETLLIEAGARLPPERVADLVRGRRWAEVERFGVRGSELDPFVWGSAIVGDAEGLEWILERGADPDAPDTYGARPTTGAVESGQTDILTLLLAAGASREDLVHVAAAGPDAGALQLLIAAGEPLETRDGSGRTPIAIARAVEFAPGVDLLLAAGVAYGEPELAWDVAHCRVDRLRARGAAVPVETADLPALARGTECAREVRAWARGRPGR